MMIRFIREVFILPIKLYRRFISPLKGTPTCRFTPTCSAYAIQAIREWGVIAGTALAVWRLLRCNPFSAGGYDPVPERKHKHGTVKKEYERKKEK